MRVATRAGTLLVLGALLVASQAEAAKAKPRAKRARRHAPSAPVFRADAANNASQTPLLGPGAAGSAMLRAQVLLDRAHWSVGEIDGRWGSNTQRAVFSYQRAHAIDERGRVGRATWQALNRDDRGAAPVVVTYTITAQDVAGPFVPIPEDTMEKATLPALNYTSPLEALAERFHASPKLLQALNPGKTLSTAGEQILVLDVSRPPLAKGASIVVDGTDLSVTPRDAQGRPIARYPATIGSEHDPLPLGEFKIKGVARNPVFHYNPDLFWDAQATDQKTTLPAGPNNPVGVVWIDLSKEHYGIHGTAEPSSIGTRQSHGCIRLTNWDAEELAELVGPGAPARLQK